jgi:hypothetical protein
LSASFRDGFTPEKKPDYAHSHWKGCSLGPRACLDGLEERKPHVPVGDRMSILRLTSPYSNQSTVLAAYKIVEECRRMLPYSSAGVKNAWSCNSIDVQLNYTVLWKLQREKM